MRQDELFDVGIGGDLADDRGWHVQAALDAGGAFGNGVVRDEEISVDGELWKAAFAVGVAAEDHGFSGQFDAPGKSGNSSMNNASGGNGEIAGVEHGAGFFGARNIVRLQLVGALLTRDKEFTQIAVCAAGFTEEIGDEFGGRRHELVAGGAVDGKRASAVFEPGRFNECGEIGAVIDVEMREENHVELGHLRTAFAETERAASSGVDKHTWAAILPDEIATGGALVLQFGSAGAEDLHGDAMLAAGLGGGEGEGRSPG